MVLRTVTYFLAVSLVAYFAMRQSHHEQDFWAKTNETIVMPPDSIPPQSQESIDIAMAMFGIMLPPSAEKPVFDPKLRDRGLTIRGTWVGKSKVIIGPSAFINWSILGSTLAHEIEIHCNQSFFLIAIMDLIGLDGTRAAERQAYLHEIKNRERFGMTQNDQELIVDTLVYYYPEKDAQDVRNIFSRQRVRSFLSEQLIDNRAR
jgi:hypothetical protein